MRYTVIVIFNKSVISSCPPHYSCVHPSQCIGSSLKDAVVYPCSDDKEYRLCCLTITSEKESKNNVTTASSGSSMGGIGGSSISASTMGGSFSASSSWKTTTGFNVYPTTALLPVEQFPSNCGRAALSNRITAGSSAGIGEYPWLALLGYLMPGKRQYLNLVQFLCGGTVISERYVLTAAHCINVTQMQLTLVRLGELNLDKEFDCENRGGAVVCADPVVDILVERVISHPGFTKNLRNDIALIKLRDKIHFTEYIQPICLPFRMQITTRLIAGSKLLIAGWGKMDGDALSGSSVLQYGRVIGWDVHQCNATVPPRLRPISDTQICAVGTRGENACPGDSGGPLLNHTVDGQTSVVSPTYMLPYTLTILALMRNFIACIGFRVVQIGIVSQATVIPCTIKEYPTIYTRVDSYLDWIEKNALL